MFCYSTVNEIKTISSILHSFLAVHYCLHFLVTKRELKQSRICFAKLSATLRD